MPHININSNKIHYNIRGEGSPLILLHDGFYNTTSWDSVRKELSKHYLVIDYDRFGYGESDRYTKSMTENLIDINVNELEILLESLNLDKVYLCGHCLGGAVAVRYTLNHPDKVIKLIAESTGFFWDHKLGIKSDWTFKPFDMIDPALKKDLVSMNGEEYARKFWEIISNYKNAYIMSEDYDILHELKNIGCPTFLISGDRDFYFDIEHTLKAFKKIKTCELWVVPNTGHTPHKEAKEEFVVNVVKFLSK